MGSVGRVSSSKSWSVSHTDSGPPLEEGSFPKALLALPADLTKCYSWIGHLGQGWSTLLAGPMEARGAFPQENQVLLTKGKSRCRGRDESNKGWPFFTPSKQIGKNPACSLPLSKQAGAELVLPALWSSLATEELSQESEMCESPRKSSAMQPHDWMF